MPIKLVGLALLVMNTMLVAKELFQALHSPLGYIIQWENWLQWLIIISIFLTAVRLMTYDYLCKKK